MDEYTRLRNRFEAYLNMPNIEMSEKEISVYTLRKLINDGLEDLRKIQFESEFKEEINKSRTIVQKVGNVFKKKVSFCVSPCTSVMASSDGNTSVLTFCFQNKKSSLRTDFLKICKDANSDQIYFGKYSSDKDFVEKHYDRISEYFTTLEHYSELYQGGVGGSGKCIEQAISDGFLDIKMISDNYGRTNLYTTINQETDKENMYTREWYKRQTLEDFFTEHEEEILKKIPVQIASLNYTYQTIVKSAISKQNVPQYVKRK